MTDLAAEYAAVLADNAVVKQDAAAVVAALKSQTASLTADLKGADAGKTYAKLEASAKTAAGKLEAEVKSGAAKYLANAGVLRRVDLAEAAYDAESTTANGKRQAAAQAAGQKLLTQLLNLETQVGTFGSAGSPRCRTRSEAALRPPSRIWAWR